ncbi:hypothetical protein TCDM_09522 [Trypanosoma cruzi Dm28c]|uniref:Uncharacterized protein n=1 Tax=Trypanosoma cruzi Dm28c TaxID=1416333 RepID=V5B9S4_TRYCR|nr:hypothetical protein TCDM_09522 [Trypanosoma cruzi Dm28c]
MRAAGEAHRAVVMSVSVGVRVEQLGGKHTAPLTGRVQKKQLKEGRVEKKTVHSDCPESKKRRDRGCENKKIKENKPLKNEKNSPRPEVCKQQEKHKKQATTNQQQRKKRSKKVKTQDTKHRKLHRMAPVCMHQHIDMRPRKQLWACRAYECVWDACQVTDVGSKNMEHTAAQQKQMKQTHNHFLLIITQ